ncbi:hypothetical protein [Streptomyces goshikiensis]
MAWGAFFERIGIRAFDGVEERGEMENGMGIGMTAYTMLGVFDWAVIF